MRLGVIDVGSNTVHLLVVDAHAGAQPLPAFSHKIELRLSESMRDDGSIAPSGAQRLVAFVRECLDVAAEQGVHEVLAFATSAIREAPNGDDVLALVQARTGVTLTVLPGPDESRLTFLAVRRWFGWSSGQLLVVDIGGGSLELAIGLDEEPDVAVSLPLGAGRLARSHLRHDPPTPAEVRTLRTLVRATIAQEVRAFSRGATVHRAVGTSKTMRSLARILGAAPSSEGTYAARSLPLAQLSELVVRLGRMDHAARAGMPGVSMARAPQLLAGALVAEAAMDLLGVASLEICPWALREGVILRRLDTLAS
ncbi:MAG TPA: Ppx/GppA phosphatase family protein [Candidatus Lustribacter sp.]|nr:Ppx/GppA phosphatase family protein [Candidatus Lustribacter sp.]